MEKINFVETGGQFGIKRRFQTFEIKTTESGTFVAHDETIKKGMTWFASSKTIEGLERMLRPYCDYRTGGF